MLIDELLPDYDVVDRHHVEVDAPAETVYGGLRALELGTTFFRRLFSPLRQPAALRSLPQPYPDTQTPGLPDTGLVLLAERPQEEMVLGTVGRFWEPSHDTVGLDARGFRDFDHEGYAKAALNFHIAHNGHATIRLTIESRVLCLDDASWRRFHLYWMFNRPFSGLVRSQVLRGIKHWSEAVHSSDPA